MRDALLVAHIAVGSVGLVLGPAVLLTRQGLQRWLAKAYLWSVVAVAVTAGVLAVTAFSRLWWLLPVAAATLAAAGLGVRRWQQRPAGWAAACAHLLGGTYVALLTGALIAGTGNPAFWVLPAVVAQVPIAVAKKRLQALPVTRPSMAVAT